MSKEEMNMDYSKYDFKDSTDLYVYLSKKGCFSRGTVEEIVGYVKTNLTG